MYRLLMVLAFIFLIALLGCGNNDDSLNKAKGHTVLNEFQFETKSGIHIENNTVQQTDEEKDDESETTEKSEQSQTKDESQDSEDEAKEQSEEETVVVQSVEKTLYVDHSSLNVRSGNGTDYGVIGQVTLNDEIEVNGITNNDWYQFDYQGQEAYVSGSYLSEDQVEIDTDSSEENNESDSNDGNESESEVEDESQSEKQTNEERSSQPLIAKTNMAQQTNQILTVVHNGGGTATVQYWKKSNDGWKQDLSVNGFVGKNGVSGQKVEGDGKTPIGVYQFNFAFGTDNPGTNVSFKQITNQSYWISNADDPEYNTWQERESSSSKDEHLIQYSNQYKYAMALNYNTHNRTPGEGSAIFLHVSNGSPTLGCISVPESTMRYLMQDINGQAQIAIVHNEQDLLNY